MGYTFDPLVFSGLVPTGGGGGGGGVTSLDGMTGPITLVPGSGITIADAPGTITIGTTAGPGPFANTFLSNLTSPTAIQQDLIPDNSGGDRSLGSAGNSWDTARINTLIDSTSNISIQVSGRQLLSTSTIVASWDTGNLDLHNNNITNLLDPVNPQDAATKNYVDINPNNKELFVLSSGDITNQYVDLSHVAKINSINFVVQGEGSQIEGASYDYSVSYTGGAGGNTRITFLNDLATGGSSALVAGNVVVAQYQY